MAERQNTKRVLPTADHSLCSVSSLLFGGSFHRRRARSEVSVSIPVPMPQFYRELRLGEVKSCRYSAATVTEFAAFSAA